MVVQGSRQLLVAMVSAQTSARACLDSLYILLHGSGGRGHMGEWHLQACTLTYVVAWYALL
jgi:hypothetical protein